MELSTERSEVMQADRPLISIGEFKEGASAFMHRALILTGVTIAVAVVCFAVVITNRDAFRSWYGRLFGEAVMLLGRHYLDRGDNREAAELFRQVVEVDELHEEAYRRLMLALTRAGDRSEALKQYERLSRVLQSDLEAEPERETKVLYERLRRAETV